MNALKPLDAVLFDLDDTLHDDSYAFTTAAEEVALEIAAERGLDALALKHAYVAEAHGFWTQLTADQLSDRLGNVRFSLWRSALERVGIADAELARRAADAYHAYRKRHFRLFPGALELLHELRSRGIKTGLVTNGMAETHREKIALLRLTEAFDAIFIADEVGLIKPDPLLFALACTRLNSAPARTAMVGDRYDRDIAGALSAGLQTVWMNVRHETLPHGKRPPHATVTDIPGMSDALLSVQSAGDE